MYDQAELVDRMFTKPEFTLVILDSCRYDAFRKAIGLGVHQHGDPEGECVEFDPSDGHDPVTGELLKARAVETHTYCWLLHALTDWYPDVEVFSGHPAINSAGETPDNFIPTVNRRISGVDENPRWRATDHFREENIHDAWARAPAEEVEKFKTHPKYVLEEIGEVGLGDRNIVWLMDPHVPYMDEGGSEEARYQNTVDRALRHAVEIVRGLSGYIVIAGDHGESFQHPSEYGLEVDWKDTLRHEPSVMVPELYEVPWLDIDT